MPLAIDLSELPQAVLGKMHQVLTDENAFELMQAKLRQQRIAKFYQENKPRAIDGLGGITMAIDPYWAGYFNMLHGRNVMLDPDFPKWLAKQDAMFALRCGGTKLQVGWEAGAGRYRKTYPAKEAHAHG